MVLLWHQCGSGSFCMSAVHPQVHTCSCKSCISKRSAALLVQVLRILRCARLAYCLKGIRQEACRSAKIPASGNKLIESSCCVQGEQAGQKRSAVWARLSGRNKKSVPDSKLPVAERLSREPPSAAMLQAGQTPSSAGECPLSLKYRGPTARFTTSAASCLLAFPCAFTTAGD